MATKCGECGRTVEALKSRCCVCDVGLCAKCSYTYFGSPYCTQHIETADEPAEIARSHGVQVDRSGVGHCWTDIDPDDMPAVAAEELAAWIVEAKPTPSDEMIASNGQRYRVTR
jgi:hypothetical protein